MGASIGQYLIKRDGSDFRTVAKAILQDGTKEQNNETVSNMLVTISGMVCDGAKLSCAAKISLAVEAALMGHDLAMENDNFLPGDGIVKADIEAMISGDIASKGMVSTDESILNVMVFED